MISSNQIIRAIKSKRSNKECARKLGVSLNEFMAKKKEFITNQFSETEKDMYVIALEEKIIEFSENVSEGTAKIKGISLSEPHSAEDIENILKIDKDKWKLSTYWNKQHKDSKGVDYWVISAMITKKQENELSVEDIDALLTKVFNKVKYVPIKTTPSNKLTNNKALFIYTSYKLIAAYVNDKESNKQALHQLALMAESGL